MDSSTKTVLGYLNDIRLKLGTNQKHSARDMFGYLQNLKAIDPSLGLTQFFRNISEKMCRMIHEGWCALNQQADRDTATALYYEILEVELDWIDPNSDDWLYNTGILEQIRWSLRERGFTHLKTGQNAPIIDLG